MQPSSSSHNLYYGVFRRHHLADGRARLTRSDRAPASIPDPVTGRHLRISTLDVGATSICPACSSRGEGGYVSFVSDLRIAYACPDCLRLIWLNGA